EPAAGDVMPMAAASPKEEPFFQDVSDRLRHAHIELPFNDYEIQPLLPYRLCRAGPGITWFDFDQDGFDDLLIPCGAGGAISIFHNKGSVNFRRIRISPGTDSVLGDQTAVLPWLAAASNSVLVAGCAKYKPGSAPSAAISFFAGRAVARSVSDLDGPVG